jgi:hypothetical protein
MKKSLKKLMLLLLCATGIMMVVGGVWAAADAPDKSIAFPRELESYHDDQMASIAAILKHRIQEEPFNLIATLIFICAIVHTFLTSKFLALAHKWEHEFEEKKRRGLIDKYAVHHGAELFHFLGEVEAVFGIWAIALTGAIFFFYDWPTLKFYITQRVNFTEALFVVVIMTLAATRPILYLAERILCQVANILGGSLTAWWFTILTVGPILGSLITEPAAMTIAALLLGNKFYALNPSNNFKYATLGLLFVNISVGGTLTHFAAPPVLMVASPWNWGIMHMLLNFGWKAVFGILASNALYYLVFKKELFLLQEKFVLVTLKDEIQKKYFKRKDLEAEFHEIEKVISHELKFTEAFDQKCDEIKERIRQKLKTPHMETLKQQGVDISLVKEAFGQRFEEIKRLEMRKALPGLLPRKDRPKFRDPEWDVRDDPVPGWVIAVHVIFMAWTIFNNHYPAIFVPGMLLFIGFAQVTSPYQNRIDLKPPLLVGFFLGGLVIHGGVQGWWIAPVLGSLSEVPLMLGATILTAFNDNAAITFLSTLVPGFTDELKYAVVAGAVAGGGLTVIANAPNPAGQSLLKKYFENGVSPVGLLKGALIPTAILILDFLILR